MTFLAMSTAFCLFKIVYTKGYKKEKRDFSQENNYNTIKKYSVKTYKFRTYIFM